MENEEEYASEQESPNKPYYSYYVSPRFLFRESFLGIFKSLRKYCFPAAAQRNLSLQTPHPNPVDHYSSFSDIPASPTILIDSRMDRPLLYAQLKADFLTTTTLIWPFIFSLTTIHDVIRYTQHPEDRFNYPLGLSLLGLSPIEASWNYHFGADLVSDPRYPWAFVLLAFFPILSIHSLLQRKRYPHVDLLLLRQAGQSLPWYISSHAIQKTTLALLMGKSRVHQERLNALSETAKQDRGLAGYQAILALAGLVESASNTEGLGALEQAALIELKTIATEASALRRLIASYQLWTLNHRPQSTRTENLFWLWATSRSLLVLLAQYHALRLLILKSYGFARYQRDKANCEAADKIFRCLNQIEDCICALCADWAEASTANQSPSVHFAQSDNPQACLTALLSEKRSPQYLLTTLPRFLGQANIEVFDASLQVSANWTDLEWDALFTLIENRQAALQTFNFSYPHSGPPPFPLSMKQLKRVNTFLHQVSIAQFDIAGQNLTTLGLAALLDSLSNISWTTFNVSRNQLNNASISVLANFIPNATKLRSLTLSETQMTDEGANLLSQAFNQSAQTLEALTHLDLSNNLAREHGLAQLISIFYNHSLTSLSLSGMPLHSAVFMALSPLLPQLRYLSAADADISDASLQALLPSNWTIDCHDTTIDVAHYDFSHNPFGDSGAERLLSILPNRFNCSRSNATQPVFANPAITLSLKYTQISDALLPIAALYLSNKYLIGLQLDGTALTSSGLIAALPEFCQPEVFLSELSIADLALSADLIAFRLAALFRNSICSERLMSLDLSNTGLSEAGAAELLPAVANTRLKQLSLANNPVTGNALRRMNQSQPMFSLTTVDLSNIALNQNDMDLLLALLRQMPHLVELKLSHNRLDSGAGVQFAEMLLTPTPPNAKQISWFTGISRDLKRILGFQRPLTRIHLEPGTKLGVLDLGDTGMDTSDARALCRVSYRANLTVASMNLDNNPAVNPRFVNPRTCEISAATHIDTELFRLFTCLAVFWLLPYLLSSCRRQSKKHRQGNDRTKAKNQNTSHVIPSTTHVIPSAKNVFGRFFSSSPRSDTNESHIAINGVSHAQSI